MTGLDSQQKRHLFFLSVVVLLEINEYLRWLKQVMVSAATSRSRTRTRRRSAPWMWTATAVILPASSTTAPWKAAAVCTIRRAGGSTSAAWPTLTALPRTQSRSRRWKHASCGTRGGRTASRTPSSLSPWRSGGLWQITDQEQQKERK